MLDGDQRLEERSPDPERQRRCGFNDCELATMTESNRVLTSVQLFSANCSLRDPVSHIVG